jgi:hypothetical protein
MNKQCPKCKIVKSLGSFNKNKRSKDGLQRVCRDCTKEEHKKWYTNNKETQLEKNKVVRENKKQWFRELKQQYSCMKCGENRWHILDFHHMDPNEKDFDVSNMGSVSKKRTLKEIEKCITLCRNCHSEFHFLEREEGLLIKDYLPSKH